jgi:hypothetical protein
MVTNALQVCLARHAMRWSCICATCAQAAGPATLVACLPLVKSETLGIATAAHASREGTNIRAGVSVCIQWGATCTHITWAGCVTAFPQCTTRVVQVPARVVSKRHAVEACSAVAVAADSVDI